MAWRRKEPKKAKKKYACCSQLRAKEFESSLRKPGNHSGSWSWVHSFLDFHAPFRTSTLFLLVWSRGGLNQRICSPYAQPGGRLHYIHRVQAFSPASCQFSPVKSVVKTTNHLFLTASSLLQLFAF
jgi:hypothetical protein